MMVAIQHIVGFGLLMGFYDRKTTPELSFKGITSRICR